VFNVTTTGNIKKVSGSGEAEFFFRIYKRTSGGVETLIGTSSNTIPVVNTGYSEFFATAIWNDGIFGTTDTIVLKYYANRISGGSNPSYDFQFGGGQPVRTIVPIPLAVIPNIYLEELADVEDGVASNNDGIFFDSSVSLWKYKSISEVLGYTPANDASVVHLAGAETITGAKTFSSDLITNRINAVASGDGAAIIRGFAFNNSVAGSFSNNTTAASNTPTLFVQQGGTAALATFQSSTNQVDINANGNISGVTDLVLSGSIRKSSFTYTLPSASGTLALTSQLHDAVTLSAIGSTPNANGATLTGQILNLQPASASFGGVITTGTQTIAGDKTLAGTLFGSVASFNGSVYAGSVSGTLEVGYAAPIGLYKLDVNGLARIQGQLTLGSTITNGTYTYTLPSSTGTLALTSALGSYLPLTGGTLTGALGGTSATFSTNGSSFGNASVGGYPLTIQTNISEQSIKFIGKNDNNNVQFFASNGSTYQAVIGTIGSDFVIGTGASGTTRLTIASTGAATFSSNVTTSAYIGIGTTSPDIIGYGAGGILGINSTTGDGSSVQIGMVGTAAAITGTMGDINFFGKNGTGAVVNRAIVRGGIDGVTTSNFISFWTMASGSLTEKMRITSGGNVGIGTTDPISKLHVSGDMRTVLTSGVGGDTLIAGINGVSNGYLISVDTSNNITHTWHTGGNIPSMRITSGGNVLIGTTTDTGYKFQTDGTGYFTGNVNIGKATSGVNVQLNINGFLNKAARIEFQESGTVKWSVGNGAASENGRFEIYDVTNGTGVQLLRGATSWTALSDERFKDIIEPISVNDKLKNIRAVIGKYKTDKDGTRRNFLFAQDLLKSFPEVVDIDKDETKPMGVRYQDLIPILVKAIQELKAEIDILKNK